MVVGVQSHLIELPSLAVLIWSASHSIAAFGYDLRRSANERVG